MSFDHYAAIAGEKACPKPYEGNLSPCFSDGCTVMAHESYPLTCGTRPHNKKPDAKNDARECYRQRANGKKLAFQSDDFKTQFEPDFTKIPFRNAIGIQIRFTLQTPWYSKDDRLFHVLDNPVRKDWVFGIPFIGATDWKGMLRWACRMQEDGFREHLKKREGEWHDPPWIVHLFGNEKEEKTDFLQGALRFYPTFFYKVGFEVINPHDREKRAGTQPIYYEVVPAKESGVLSLLYAPARPGRTTATLGERKECLGKLVHVVNDLLTNYGISAKRTAGWGTCRIENESYIKYHLSKKEPEDMKSKVQQLKQKWSNGASAQKRENACNCSNINVKERLKEEIVSAFNAIHADLDSTCTGGISPGRPRYGYLVI